jgi:hypothetical protein
VRIITAGNYVLLTHHLFVLLQKKNILSDPSLPNEYRISLARSLRHNLFSQAMTVIRGIAILQEYKLMSVSLQIPFLINVQEKIRATLAAEVYPEVLGNQIDLQMETIASSTI